MSYAPGFSYNIALNVLGLLELPSWMMGDEPCSNGLNEGPAEKDNQLEDSDSSAVAAETVDDTLKCQSIAASRLSTPMAERERRNISRSERVCSNAQSSKNHQRQQDITEPVRNRPRDKGDSVCCTARNRSGTTLRSGNSSEVLTDGACLPEASATAVNTPDEGTDDAADVQIESLPPLATPIRTTDFFGLSPEAIHTAVSTHNWQVIYFMHFWFFTDFIVSGFACISSFVENGYFLKVMYSSDSKRLSLISFMTCVCGCA